MSASVILLLIVAAAALAFGNTFTAITDAYYRGLWMLLPFTMQMTLILVLSTVVSGTMVFRRLVVSLARWPRTLTQVIALSVVLEAALSYCTGVSASRSHRSSRSTSARRRKRRAFP